MDVRVRSWPHFADWFSRDRRCTAVPHPDADAIPDEVDYPVAYDVSNADPLGLEHAVRDAHADTDDDIWRVAVEHADADMSADADVLVISHPHDNDNDGSVRYSTVQFECDFYEFSAHKLDN